MYIFENFFMNLLASLFIKVENLSVHHSDRNKRIVAIAATEYDIDDHTNGLSKRSQYKENHIHILCDFIHMRF